MALVLRARGHANMTTPPDARNEYSRARAAFPVPAALLAAAALLGAALLVVAEFAPLYSVRYVTSARSAGTVSAGAHNSYALLPIALLAAVLAAGLLRTSGRPLLAALAGLGVLALLIALVGDLPDAHTHGLTARYVLAATTPGAGLYLETAGAIVLG